MKIAQFMSCTLYMCDTDFEFCLETCQLMLEINMVILKIIEYCNCKLLMISFFLFVFVFTDVVHWHFDYFSFSTVYLRDH